MKKKGTQSEKLYIILSGRVGVFHKQGSKDINNESLPTQTIYENQSFGDEGMLEQCLYESSYKALTKTLCLTLEKKDLIEVLSNSKIIESGIK